MQDEQATCRTCGSTKPNTEFDIRADTGRLCTKCKDCRRKYQRVPDDARRRTQWLVGTSELLRCRVCGELKPWNEFPRRGRDSCAGFGASQATLVGWRAARRTWATERR